jgi:hypothetical protein
MRSNLKVASPPELGHHPPSVKRILAGLLTALVLIPASCVDPVPTAPQGLVSRIDGQPLNEKTLLNLRAVGEGCSVTARDRLGKNRGLALRRSDLPVDLPPIEFNSDGIGNGRMTRIVLERPGESPVLLGCVVPETLTPEELTKRLVARSNGSRWKSILSSLEHAREIPPAGERTLSREAQEFEAELLGSKYMVSPFRTKSRPSTRNCQDDPMAPDTGEGGRMPSGNRANLNCWEDCKTWDILIWFNGSSWSFHGFFYFCVNETPSGGGIDYSWLVEHTSYQWPCSQTSTASAADTLAAQYRNTTWYDSTAFGNTVADTNGATGYGSLSQQARAAAYFMPNCHHFETNLHTIYFEWSELAPETSSHGIYLLPIWIDTSEVSPGVRIGLDAWRKTYGSARNLNSVYRQPHRNYEIVPRGARGSSHMRGVAVDMRNETQSFSEYTAMHTAALTVRASYIEPTSGPCGLGCTHADWRWWVNWPNP